MTDPSKSSQAPHTSNYPSVKPESKLVPQVIPMDTYIESTYATQEGNLVKYDASFS